MGITVTNDRRSGLMPLQKKVVGNSFTFTMLFEKSKENLKSHNNLVS